jgi:prepilin-type N-terminal cleavage/methylation domain-containing protein
MRLGRSGHSGVTLVELVVAMAIMGVLSTMILVVWFSLQDSYAFTTRADRQREVARDAAARMVREVRDIQAQTGIDAVVVAKPDEFWFYSGFNLPNQLPADKPRATRYTYDSSTNTIYRQRDRSEDANQSPLDEPKVPVVANVVNDQIPKGSSTPVFTYVVYDGTGTQVPMTTVTGSAMQEILSVEIRVITDVNPGKSPVYFDLRTAAQPRNLRRY